MMADTKQKVPNLRFKGFTNDWEQRKLGDISTRVLRKNKDLQSTLPLTISAQDGLVDQTTFFHKQVASKQLSNYILLFKGEFAYNKSYSEGYPFGAIKRLNKYSKGVLSTLYIVFKPKNVNSDFLEHYYDTSKWYREIYRNAAEGARNHGLLNISAKDFFGTMLYIPQKNEQALIANVLDHLDCLISLQQRKLDLLKQLKKGLLQKMFADKGSKRPILRFEGFNDDWEGRKLENSADYIRGSFPQPYGNKEWYGGTNAKPFVQVVDVNTNMRLNKKTKEQISVLAQPKSRFVPSDSIVVTLQGSIGRVAITQYDSYVDRTLLIFTKYKVPVDKYFWAYSIQNIFRIEKQKAPGGTIKTITKRALSSFEVSLPVQEEQKKIGTLLKNIDDIITSQQEEVSKLKKIKKSLLQQMFI